MLSTRGRSKLGVALATLCPILVLACASARDVVTVAPLAPTPSRASQPAPAGAQPGGSSTSVLLLDGTAPPSSAPVTTAPPPLNLYAFTGVGAFAPQVADVPARVYVPNSDAHSLTVIDPANGQVLSTVSVGALPHHVTPSWDLSTLYVLDTAGNAIYPIDPRSGQLGGAIAVEDPYNLYFTPDGSTALVVAERYQRIDARDPHTWELLWSVPVPHPGVNHGDFSPDGRYFYASSEFSGWFVKIDLVERRVVAESLLGEEPIDTKFSPDGSKLYVADQVRSGVIVVDPTDLREVGFIPTGPGTHGLYPSRDATQLYATNRLGGSVSVIDVATDQVVATWTIPGGGSPDMGSVSPDGTQFWVSGRYNSEVYVFNTATGALEQRIRAGGGAHGLTYFPQPGRFSLGHTGNYR